jgi:hypothetical protein
MKTTKNLIQFKNLTDEQKKVAWDIAKTIPYSLTEAQRLWFNVIDGKVIPGTCIDKNFSF